MSQPKYSHRLFQEHASKIKRVLDKYKVHYYEELAPSGFLRQISVLREDIEHLSKETIRKINNEINK